MKQSMKKKTKSTLYITRPQDVNKEKSSLFVVCVSLILAIGIVILGYFITLLLY
jgi:hypothetical protein